MNEKTNHIISIGGEKGGIGKSFLCRAIIEDLITQNIPLQICDTDRSKQINQMIKFTYPEEYARKQIQTRKIDLIEETEGLSEHIDKFFDNSWIPERFNTGITLIDLGAGLDLNLMKGKIEKNIYEFFMEEQNAIHLHCIVIGTEDTPEIIEKIDNYQKDPNVKLIVVSNFYPDYKGSNFTNEINEICEKRNIPAIMLPKLFSKTATWLRQVEKPELYIENSSLQSLKENGFIPIPISKIGQNWRPYSNNIERKHLQALVSWWREWKKNTKIFKELLNN